jgi:acyl-CoA thioester hydrolase
MKSARLIGTGLKLIRSMRFMTRNEVEIRQISRVHYRVCYEDTDAGGVVYYANYLRYMERGRNEILRELGFSVKQFQDMGVLFPVVQVNIQYRSPAFLDDVLLVESRIEKVGHGSVLFLQRVFREGDRVVLVEGKVRVACVDGTLKPRRLPEEIRRLRTGELSKNL